MKHIVKMDAPKDFAEWKDFTKDASTWKPNYADMPSDIKNSVKNSLRKEQGGICCYCERRLDINDSHIEHFRPQSNYPADSLEYGNMLCSCLDKLRKREPRHCGPLKADWFDEQGKRMTFTFQTISYTYSHYPIQL